MKAQFTRTGQAPALILGGTAIAGLLALSACGGGGSSLAPVHGLTGSGSTVAAPGSGSTTGSSSTGNGTLSMKIAIPAKAGSSSLGVRSPQYISASTQSMTVSLVTTGTPKQIFEADLTPTSPNCAAVVNGGTQCTVSFGAPAGSDMLLVNTYDATGGKGNLLSSATLTASLTAGTTSTIPVVLNGVATTATVVLGTSSLLVGTAGATSVGIQASDADGNIIVGPGGFTSPVALKITNDTNSTLTLSTSSITAPGQIATVAYNGGSLVAAAITPSGTGITGTAATVAATGSVINEFQPDTNQLYLYPYGPVTALPNASAAFFVDAEFYSVSNSYQGSYYGIATVSPTSLKTVYVGDSTNPFQHAAPGSLTLNGATVINGMNQGIEYEPGYAYHTLATSPTGKVAYIAWYNNVSGDTTNCPSGTESSGLIGVLDPAAGTVSETPLKGYPYYVAYDSAGDIWFVENSGTCSTTGTFLPSGYSIGEITAGGAIKEGVTGTSFTALGINSNAYPSDMAVTPDGSTIYVSDYQNNRIYKIATASFTLSSIGLIQGSRPYTIATAPDGTVAWFTDSDPEDDYVWGFVPGTATFGAASLVEPTFITNYFYSETMSYGDGSFWLAGEEYGTGIGRLANVSSGSPIQSYYPLPYPDGDGPELYGIASGYGYVWAADDEYDNFVSMQYGAPKSGTLSPTVHARMTVALPKPHRTATVHARK